ncbi:hypothetical protein MCOR27_002579 [Pyricularia oryzae]|uniref:Rhodopsin domain-containing protein n=1 Tax=Pyricularia grisea TaxID=148305 RepID=A0ABQ8N664_PYRGI|nr:hypothetical protein MCOR01_009362 [Pyricularia oryzae]KAI6291421.1 hypothetical protein MCOR33_010641 [Pyricularia grisea]KAI6254671.1 hypothetical protein MCOR19_008823 [Pyricularia oryzae]KAI6265046.1 hypothetical protein MCOR26_010952 [Pyricularia oryzae]KAI6284817.1 hypothetical protein MCOR27_002579 [Pyricularia oryzae]
MAEGPSKLPGLPGFHRETIQPWIVAVEVTVNLLALVSVGLRLLSRRIKSQRLWWDDYTIMFSMVWNFMVVGFAFAMYSNGMGLHADKVPLNNIVMMAKWLVVAEIFYAWNLVWTKLSLLLMYIRIFQTSLIRRICIGIGILVVCWGFTIMFIFIFICVPVNKLWYPDIPGHCINQVATWIANAASTILTDIAILVIPFTQIWNLQLRRIDKIGLTFAFGLGFFVVFASSYRTTVLFTYSNQDPTYTLAPTVGWTAIEVSAGIISACLPTMRPSLQYFGRKCGIKRSIFGSSDDQDSDRSNLQNLGSANGAPLTIGGGAMYPSQKPAETRTKPRSTTISSRHELFDGKTGVVGSINARISSASSGIDERLHGHDDDRAAAVSLQSPPDADLRPDVRDVMYRVSSYTSNGGNGEFKRKGSEVESEIPPNGIMVQKDITQSSSRIAPHDDDGSGRR